MKLRLRGNSLRLRLSQTDVADLASGKVLDEKLSFPGGAEFAYTLSAPKSAMEASAQFLDSTVRVVIPGNKIKEWAEGDELGLYYELPAGQSTLKIAIEKDLQCADEPVDERDPDAYPRAKAC